MFADSSHFWISWEPSGRSQALVKTLSLSVENILSVLFHSRIFLFVNVTFNFERDFSHVTRMQQKLGEEAWGAE